ncbi:6110_t:CDS:1, partial [Gigaspora margarita]
SRERLRVKCPRCENNFIYKLADKENKIVIEKEVLEEAIKLFESHQCLDSSKG